jgi:3-oxoacyl-[acyl-carrier protein] reductase
VAADITTEAGRAAVFALGHDFDIVVTNAGGPPPGDFRNWDREAWIKAVDANMLTPIELIKATVDGMAKRGFGRIVNITSSSVKSPIDILGLSNGARSGLTGFVAGVARTAIAAQGVTINNLLPGSFDTDRLKGTMAGTAQKTGQDFDTVWEARKKNIPAKRFGTPAEFGAICAFLCSLQAGYMTGRTCWRTAAPTPAPTERLTGEGRRVVSSNTTGVFREDHAGVGHRAARCARRGDGPAAQPGADARCARAAVQPAGASSPGAGHRRTCRSRR